VFHKRLISFLRLEDFIKPCPVYLASRANLGKKREPQPSGTYENRALFTLPRGFAILLPCRSSYGLSLGLGICRVRFRLGFPLCASASLRLCVKILLHGFRLASNRRLRQISTMPAGSSMIESEPFVFVVDDDLSVRRSTERLIRAAGLKVQTFTSAEEFLKNARFEGPACLVLDVRMPGFSGMDLQSELTQSGIHIPIIFITGHGDIPMSVRAMKAGAVEFLTKPFRSRSLLEAVRAAIETDRSAHKARSETGELRQRYEQLTPREREVMALVVAGQLNKQVAGELSTTERTIKFHRAHIMQKMGVESLADLVRMAEKLGVSSQS